jgi:hypothetical protein
MPPLSSLGTFLTLSFLLPGIIIFSALVLLFPESYFVVEKRTTLELVALVLVIAFLNGHLAFLFEIYVLNRLWQKMYPALELAIRSKNMHERSKILAAAEINGFAHAHFDAIFGEFVLFTNTSFWIFVISVSKLFFVHAKSDLFEAALTMCSSIIILVFTSPFFKHQYLAALETIKMNNEKHELVKQSQELSTTEASPAEEKAKSAANPQADAPSPEL